MRSKQRHRTQNFPQASKEQREHLDNVNLWHQYRKVYLKAWTLSLVIVLAEVIGAAASGSRALQADIGHVAGDVIIASAPLIMSTLPSRGESRLILATGGVLTALTLAAIGIIIGIEAWQDLRGTGHGHHVGGWTMSAFALMAGLLNFWQHRILSIVSPAHRHLVHRGFHFHVLADLTKNLVLPVAGVLIALSLVPGHTDIWLALIIGVWITIRAVLLLAGCLKFTSAGRLGQ